MKKIITAAIILCLILSLAAIFTACDSAPAENVGTEDGTDSKITYETFQKDDPETETNASSSKVTYTVTVKDSEGNAIEGVEVQICVGSVCKTPKKTDADGAVEFSIDATDESLSLQINEARSPEGYVYPTEKQSVDADQTEITVILEKN